MSVLFSARNSTRNVVVTTQSTNDTSTQERYKHSTTVLTRVGADWKTAHRSAMDSSEIQLNPIESDTIPKNPN